jgi:CheY-like chemotaxis protein
VQNHDGAITVYSEPGKGTTFNLFFPVVSAAADEVATQTHSVPSGNGQQILFVDDEKAITELASILLPRIGYSPTICHSAVEALATFRADPDRFDAIITDLTMPQMTGVMLAREVHSVRPELPILLTTGYSGGNDFSRAREAGIKHLIAKPFSLQTLAENLQQVLTRR